MYHKPSPLEGWLTTHIQDQTIKNYSNKREHNITKFEKKKI
jgi:hypothetical protein